MTEKTMPATGWRRLTRAFSGFWSRALGEKRHPRNGELPVEYFRFPPF